MSNLTVPCPLRGKLMTWCASGQTCPECGTHLYQEVGGITEERENSSYEHPTDSGELAAETKDRVD